MKKLSQKNKVWNLLIKNGQIDNWSTIDSRLSIRLSAIIFNLRNEKGQDHILTDDEFNGDNGKNCIYKLSPEHYRHVQINNGSVNYWEKIWWIKKLLSKS